MPRQESSSKRTKKTWAKGPAHPTARRCTSPRNGREKPELSEDAAEEIDTDDDEMLRDGGVFPLDVISKLLMNEVREYARQIKTDRRCMLCPFRSFNKPYRVRDHVRLYHTSETNWCASGRKQLRICVALYDFDILSKNILAQSKPTYLRRSASIIRGAVAAPEFTEPEVLGLARRNLVGGNIRMAQYASGPKLHMASDLRNRRFPLRRIGYGYYSQCFYNNVAKACMLHECRIEREWCYTWYICAGTSWRRSFRSSTTYERPSR